MLAAIPAAPAVGLGAMLTAGLLALLLTLVLMGLYEGYAATLGALLQALAEKVRGIKWVGGKIADVLDSIDDTVRDSIGAAILQSEKSAARFFHGLAWLWEETVNSVVASVAAIADAFDGLREGEIPRQVKEQTTGIRDKVATTDTRSRARERAIERNAASGIDRLQRDLAAEKLAREKGIDAIDAKIRARVDGALDAVEGAVAGTRAWAGRQFGTLDARIGTVATMVGAGALTAAAVRALDLRFPFYKCGNVQRFNRQLCRAPLGSLDDLFGLALLTVGSLSIVELARELQVGTEFAAGAVHDWIRED